MGESFKCCSFQNTIANTMANPAPTAIGMAFGPVAGFAAQAISNAISAANRGVTGPNDASQAQTSVQSAAPSPS
jgi:hypothetical protein